MPSPEIDAFMKVGLKCIRKLNDACILNPKYFVF